MRASSTRPTINRFHRRSLGIAAAAAALLGVSLLGNPAVAQPRDSFRIAWSIYVGWMPWGYGEAEGIVKKWADKYDIDIEVVQINDYVESINLYTGGSFDGVTLTNMDALTIPAAGGVDTTALILGSTSNGNDGIVLKGASSLAAIKGRNVNLVELSVSHYLLARGLESVGLTERDVRVVNTSDADIVSVSASPDVTAVVAWKPQLSEISAMQGSNLVFDSSRIPGEIIDTLSVNTEVLAANPNLGKALVGAWYEIMQLMSKSGRDRQSRARRDGRGVRHRPCGIRGAARDHAAVLHAGRRHEVCDRRAAARNHGLRAAVCVRARAARRKRVERGFRRYRLRRRQRARQSEQRAPALQRRLREARSRGEALAPSATGESYELAGSTEDLA